MHDENWQIYTKNNQPLAGKGAKKAQFKKDTSLIMGNAHVWFWRKNTTGETEIMLQKRSHNIATYSGWYHISAGGHINVGETPIEAAVREVQEEMGIVIDPSALYFVYSCRLIPQDANNIVNVFLYELPDDSAIRFTDGEVDSFEWKNIDEWKKMTQAPEKYKLVPQQSSRFDLLTRAVEYIAGLAKV